jgi:hypothetical protein
LVVVDFAPRFWRWDCEMPAGVPENRGGHGIPRDLLLSELTAAEFEVQRIERLWWFWPEDRYGVVAAEQ